MNTSLRGQLSAATTLAELERVWVEVLRARGEHMSAGTFNKCQRVYHERQQVLA